MKHRLLAILTILILIPYVSEAKKKNTKSDKIEIVAHRGFWNCEEAGYARNSIAALRCAQEAGFYGSEFDVNMTKDSVLIIFHDDNVEGKKIEKHTYDEFKHFRLENGEHIPTLDEYLEQGKKYPQTMLVYELKKHSSEQVEDLFVDLTIRKLQEHGLLDPERVMFISFSFHMCSRLAEKLPEFTVQYLEGNKKPSKVKAKGISGIDYNQTVLSLNSKWIRNAHSNKMSVNVWTVNKEHDMEKMIGLGVDQITSDNPLNVRTLLNQLNIREGKGKSVE